MKKLFFLALLAALLLAGCHKGPKLIDSDMVPQENIFQLYTVTYDAQKQEMSATATFRIDHRSGQLLKLTADADVTADGHAMKLNKEGAYTCELDQYKQKIPFIYTNNSQAKFKNVVITNSIEFSSEAVTLSKEKGGTISVKAEPFEEGESVSCILSRGDDVVEFDLEQGNGSVAASPESLESVAAGTYDAQLVRKGYSDKVNALDRGGLWETKYISKTKKITIQ
ncbi:MAG: hypothetical protein K6A95_02590 [Bacteroidales bacterium]|nr:hypothetical protein [Bacteroidales bacterium]